MGHALPMACAMFDLECEVFMVKVSFDQKPYRRVLMETWGATVHASPSKETQAGQNILEDRPDSTGSLGIAISEAVEIAAQNGDTSYSLGSVLNHVCTHQTVIGLEAKKQMEAFEDPPDVVVGCVGGGSNYAGLSTPSRWTCLNEGAKIVSWRSNLKRARLSPRHLRCTISETRPAQRRSCPCTPSVMTSSPRPFTPVDCGITGTLRAFADW